MFTFFPSAVQYSRKVKMSLRRCRMFEGKPQRKDCWFSREIIDYDSG